MGLDMYAYARATLEHEAERPDNNFGYGKELAYWRKFNALHGWMEDRYAELKGDDAAAREAQWPYFNGPDLELTPALIDRLAKEAATIKPRAGFFWGRQAIEPVDMESLADFIQEARYAFEAGLRVFYSASY